MNPSIIGYSVLDSKTINPNFDHFLKGSVHDALWALTMQWKLGEFKGEDTGSAIKTQIHYNTTKINRIQTSQSNVVGYNDNKIPMEARIERERIEFNLNTRIQLGRYWLKLMSRYNLDGYKSLFIESFPIKLASTRLEKSNKNASRVRNLARGRIVDGRDLYLYLAGGKTATELANFVEDSDTTFQSGDITSLSNAIDAFESHISSLFSEPENSNDFAWNSNRLEYDANCSAPKENSTDQTVLMANEYTGGYMDWYSFDKDPSGNPLNENPGEDINNNVHSEDIITFLPNKVRFPGQPRKRWWTMEDGSLNYAKIKDFKTSILGKITKRYIFSYNNDWSTIPLEIEAGSIVDIKSIVVKDTFGDYVYVGGKPILTGQFSDQNWNMFKLNEHGKQNKIDNRLFIPPVVPQIIDSEPLEEVNFIRDQKANMVWGIETKVPDELGGFKDGAVAEKDLINYLKPNDFDQEETDSFDFANSEIGENTNIEKFKYFLLSEFPGYWIPFIPQQINQNSGEIAFKRATYPRIIEGLELDYSKAENYVHPKGKILSVGLDNQNQYTIKEEEIPRAGIYVKRTFHRCRWYNGKTVIWAGRNKEIGHGEGLSGLKHDYVKSKNKLG